MPPQVNYQGKSQDTQTIKQGIFGDPNMKLTLSRSLRPSILLV